MNESKKKNSYQIMLNIIRHHKIWIALTFMLILFWDLINQLAIKIIIPILSTIPNNNLGIAIMIALIPFFIAVYKQSSFLNKTIIKRCTIPNRYIAELYFIIVYIFLKVSPYYLFYSVSYSEFDYVTGAICVTFIIEVQLFVQRKIQKNEKNLDTQLKVTEFYYDIPTEEDKYGRGIYADILLYKIIRTFEVNNENINSFVVNIAEEYGYGKTSFFLLVKKKLEKCKQQFIVIDYKPWLCEDESSIIAEFFHLLSEHFEDYDDQLNKKIDKYINSLICNNTSNSIISVITPIFLKSSSLRKEHDDIKQTIEKINLPILILIDDVDRLQKNEFMALLKLVRNTADFPNFFYLMATDKRYMTEILKDSGIKDASLYLKKFINYELLLPANDNIIMQLIKEKLSILLSHYIKEKEDVSKELQSILHLPKLEYAFRNPRDLIRFLNSYTFVLDAIYANKEKIEIDYTDLFAITLIQHLNSDIYKVLRDYDDWLLTLVGKDHRYVLKEKYNSIYEDSELISFLETLKKRRSISDDKEKCNEKANSFQTFEDVLTDAAVSDEQIVMALIKYLFADAINYRAENRICHNDAYFRYFSAGLKNDQISRSEFNFILALDDAKYQEKISEILIKKKAESFIHKFKYVAEDCKEAKIVLIRKLFIFINEDCKKYPNVYNVSISKLEENCFKTYNLSVIFRAIFESNGQKVFCNEKLGIEINGLIEKSQDVNLCALLLCSLESAYPQILIFTYQKIKKWREILVQRFLEEKIINNPDPFTDEILDVIPNLISHFINSSWDKQFSQYINNIPNYMDWFVRLVTITDNNIEWDEIYMKQLNFYMRGNLNDFLTRCDNINKDERLIDLKESLRITNLNKEDIDKHPFLIYRKELGKTNSDMLNLR